MSTPRTYWVDLTDLYLWTGHHTGIQRVVYNIAKYYAQRPDTRFFIYDDKKHKFFEIEFKQIKVPKKRVRVITRRSELRDDVIFQVKSAYHRLPQAWRKSLSPVLKPVARQAYHKTHHMIYLTRQALRSPKTAVKMAKVEANFVQDDVIIILGAGWIRPSIVTDLWYLKRDIGFKVMHFIHDMIPTYQPHLFGPGHFELATRYMFEAITVADGIITNSKSSERDTIKFMREQKLPEVPIGIIRLGDELLDIAEPVKPAAEVEPGKYLLAVGTLEIRKNHILLYNAYKLASAAGINLPPLVIVGRPGWHAGDVLYSIVNDPEVNDKIAVLEDTSDGELVWLFQNCQFAIYPATYEGWGLPHAEALVFGKVSLTSSTSSLPEVAGDLVSYFNPFDAADCLRVIRQYLDPQFLAKAEARIAKEYKTQSWHDCYDQCDRAVTKLLKQVPGSGVADLSRARQQHTTAA